MRLFFNIFLLPFATIFTGSAIAADLDPSPVPQSAFFGGLGVNGSSVNFANQRFYAGGTTWQPGPIIGWGAGSTDFMLNSSSAPVPVIQAGYFQHFSSSLWIWGSKVSYSYLNVSADRNLLIPQTGGVTETSGAVTTNEPFAGNYTVQTYRQTINHQFSLIPLIGRSFEKSYLYLGGGPTFAQTKISIDNMASPIAFVDGLPISPTGVGNGSNYSTNQWLFGGVAIVGATYFINPNWFVDLSYSYSATGIKKSSWGGPWSDTLPNESARIGNNAGTSSGSVNTQAFSVSINAVF
jgi:opacity protein-like surface antigen